MGLFNFLAGDKKPAQQNQEQNQPAQSKNTVQASLQYLSNIWNGSDDNLSWGFTKSYTDLDYDQLQKRSLQLYRENPIAHGYIRMLTDNIVYKGMKVKPQPNTKIIQLQYPNITDDDIKEIKEQIKAYFDNWADSKVSICGQYTFYEIQQMVQESRELFGDCLILIKYRSDDLPQLQLIAGDRITTDKNIPDQNIYNGVEINPETGKPIAYFVKKTNTDASLTNDYIKISINDDKGRLQAIFVKSSISKLPHEVRGLAGLSVIMQPLKDLVDGIKNENLAAKLSSLFVGVHKKNVNMPDSFTQNPDMEITNIHGDDTLTKKIDKGTFLDLPQGDDFSILQNPKPNPNFTNWADLMINKMFAIGTRIGSQKLELKFNSSYSSARQVSIEANDTIELKSDDLNNQFNNIIYQIILDNLIEHGLLTIANYQVTTKKIKDKMFKQAWNKCTWQSRLQRHIDPVKHMKEIKMKLELNLMTYAEAAEQVTGNNYEHVLRENTHYRELIKELRQKGLLNPDDINQAKPEDPPPKPPDPPPKTTTT